MVVKIKMRFGIQRKSAFFRSEQVFSDPKFRLVGIRLRVRKIARVATYDEVPTRDIICVGIFANNLPESPIALLSHGPISQGVASPGSIGKNTESETAADEGTESGTDADKDTESGTAAEGSNAPKQGGPTLPKGSHLETYNIWNRGTMEN